MHNADSGGLKHELILGGARSGKSRTAESRALSSGEKLVYVATATAGDQEMTARIELHQQRRGPEWALIEEATDLAGALAPFCNSGHCIVVDCLTLWLSNCLIEGSWPARKADLLKLLPALQSRVIMVSNETGLGIVPVGELTRKFVDEAGFLHQELGGYCERVTFMVAGLPLELKTREES